MENRKQGVHFLRVLIGLFLIKDFLGFLNNRMYLFDINGIVSYATYQDIIHYYNIEMLNIDFTNEFNVLIFCILGLLCSIMFTIGLLPKISAFFLFLLLLIFKFRNIYLLDGGDNMLTVLLPLFFFIDSKCLFETNNRKCMRFKILKTDDTLSKSKLFVFALMVQICIIYFFSGIHKLQGEVWREGIALYYILNSDDFSPYPSVNEILSNSSFCVYGMTWFTIFFQILFPFFVFHWRTRTTILVLGILLHLGIFFLMRIDNFSFLMIACYTIFFTDQEYDKAKVGIQKLLRL